MPVTNASDFNRLLGHCLIYRTADSYKRYQNPKGKNNKLAFTRDSFGDLAITNNFFKLDSTTNFTNFQKYDWHRN